MLHLARAKAPHNVRFSCYRCPDPVTATLHDMGCNFTAPFDHSAPVHHGGHQLPLREWPDDCVWAQLQYERWQQDRNGSNYTSPLYLENLEKEWGRRAICSRCHREIDQDLDRQMLNFNALVTLGPLVDPKMGFQSEGCWNGVCLYRRSGPCLTSAPFYEVNKMLVLSDQ